MNSSRWVCPACSCLCDDLTIERAEDSCTINPRCAKAESWLRRISANKRSLQSPPTAESDRVIVALRTALTSAQFPLMTGLGNLPIATQQIAVKLAEKYEAGLDVAIDHRGSNAMDGLLRHGRVTATLGEVANRADFVLLCFCDPMETHPRLFDRVLKNPSKPFKRIVVVDRQSSPSAELADQFIQSDDPLKFVSRLSDFLKADTETKSDSAEAEVWRQLMGAEYGAVFLSDDADAATVDQWYPFVREMNQYAPLVLSTLRRDRNGRGCEQVLTSLTGFPGPLRFENGEPHYDADRYASAQVLQREQCDLLLVCDIGAEVPFEQKLSASEVDFLKKIPVAVLSDFPLADYETVDFYLPAGTPGWNCGGDFYRLDGIPIPLVSLTQESVLAPDQLFRMLLQ